MEKQAEEAFKEAYARSLKHEGFSGDMSKRIQEHAREFDKWMIRDGISTGAYRKDISSRTTPSYVRMPWPSGGCQQQDIGARYSPNSLLHPAGVQRHAYLSPLQTQTSINMCHTQVVPYVPSASCAGHDLAGDTYWHGHEAYQGRHNSSDRL